MTLTARTEHTVPTINQFVDDILEEQGLAAELRLLDAEEDYTKWTAYDFLSHADSFLKYLFLRHKKEWDSRDQATALFRAYQAHIQVTEREDLHRDVRLVGALYTFDEKDETYTLIEYREGKRIQEFDMKLSVIPSDVFKDSNGMMRVYEAPWGEELKQFLEHRSTFGTGTNRGVC